MASFLARRLGVMLLTMLCLTLVVFYLVNLEPNLRKLAISQTEMHSSDQQLGLADRELAKVRLEIDEIKDDQRQAEHRHKHHAKPASQE